VTAPLSEHLWLAFLIAFFLLRLVPRWHSIKTPVRVSARGVREAVLLSASFTGLGLIPCIYVLVGVPQFADYPFSSAQGYVGIAVYVTALWLFYRTHRDLGRNWSMSLDVREQHTLITTGVYGCVRHPMYTAFWLMAFAQLFLLPNWIAGPAGLAGFGTLFFGRLPHEEEMMIAAFGEEYRDYMRRTSRIFPGLY
jgi:protein-S-isoprenylcysteine O-methyltransferase Ste14